MLRRVVYRLSYDKITAIILGTYVGMPTLCGNISGFSYIIDAIALKSAALVALCDPLELVNDESYPTILTVDGLGKEASKQEETSMYFNKFSRVFDDFTKIYVAQLVWLFNASNHKGRDASFALNDAVDRLDSGHTNRHPNFDTIHPYFWIEPTGLFEKPLETPACKERWTVLAILNKLEKYCILTLP